MRRTPPEFEIIEVFDEETGIRAFVEKTEDTTHITIIDRRGNRMFSGGITRPPGLDDYRRGRRR